MRPDERGGLTIARTRDRLARARRPRPGQEDGFGIVEVIAAFTIIFVGFFALASATGSATHLIVAGGQRQAATGEANARLEDLRNIPYANTALSTQPAHSSDVYDPDYWVNTGGTTYDYDHDGVAEDLIVDTAAGQVRHLDSLAVGQTTMSIYSYVTWVDDPNITGARDYRRATIVTVTNTAGGTARSNTTQVSALVTAGSVTVGGGSASVPTQGSSSPTPSPSPSTGTCGGDATAPTGTFSILSGTGAQAGFTASTTATLSLAPSDPCAPINFQISNDNVTYSSWTVYDAAAPTVSWTLTGGDGSKSVWVHFKDGAGNQATAGPLTITLDQTLPTVPGTLTRTVSCSGSNRTVNLSWGVSTDTNRLGYRVYKSVNAGAYVQLGSISTTSMSDTDSKSLTSLSYRVVGYDKAGNEGNPTDVISLSKNQCA